MASTTTSEPNNAYFPKGQWRSKTRQRHARMQYRKDKSGPWQDLEGHYKLKSVTENYPEPPNVLRAVLSTNGITVHQSVTGETNHIEDSQMIQELHGWKVKFVKNGISNIFCEEYDAPLWTKYPKGSMRSFYVVRFECTGCPESEEINELTAQTETSLTSDDKGRAADMRTSQKPSDLPLAQLCQDPKDLVGMEVRLAFRKWPSRPTQPESWRWPMVVNFLVGSPWKIVNDAESRAPLNTWAESVKDHYREAILTKVTTDERVEWCLQKKRKVSAQEEQPRQTLEDLEEQGREGQCDDMLNAKVASLRVYSEQKAIAEREAEQRLVVMQRNFDRAQRDLTTAQQDLTKAHNMKQEANSWLLDARNEQRAAIESTNKTGQDFPE